ncbi:MAG: hypothetical protein ACP5MM_09800, partial [Acidithiobacillus sp.]|uniref:hypothetical protein n=1 Tax=Acidithiobacillus sp. TaxID=1872118 RepID=UPI003D007F97
RARTHYTMENIALLLLSGSELTDSGFYPDRFDLSQQPGLKIGTVCHGVSYKVIKQTYGEYEVPDKAFVQTSLSVYEGAIRLNDSVRTWQGHKTLSDVDKHALLPFDERGWIRVRIQTRCVEPGQKPDNSWEDYEISKGGMLSNYLVDGIFLLKKISDQPAAPGPGSLPKLGQGTGTIQTQKPAAPARKSLIGRQRRWSQTRDAGKVKGVFRATLFQTYRPV